MSSSRSLSGFRNGNSTFGVSLRSRFCTRSGGLRLAIAVIVDFWCAKKCKTATKRTELKVTFRVRPKAKLVLAFNAGAIEEHVQLGYIDTRRCRVCRCAYILF